MKKSLGLIFSLLFLFLTLLKSQDRQVRLFGLDQGLSDGFVHNIFFDDNGFLWAGTGNGLCRFDGLNFVTNPTRDSLPIDYMNVSFKDPDGNFWLGYNDGTLVHYNGKNFRIISPADSTISRVVGITMDSKGKIFAATQRAGVIIVSPNMIPEYQRDVFSDISISSFALLRDDTFLLGTFSGLYSMEYHGETFQNKKSIETGTYSNIQTILYNEIENHVYLGTQNEGLIVLKNVDGELELSDLKLPDRFSQIDIRDIYQEDNGDLWLSTFNEGVLQFKPDENFEGFHFLMQFNSANVLPGDYTSQILRDFEGNLWIATYGQGLVYVSEKTFSVFSSLPGNFGTNVLSITQFGENLFLGGTSSVLSFPFNNSNDFKLWGVKNGMPEDDITALVTDQEGNLYIGTASKGIYLKQNHSDRISQFYFSRNSPANVIHFLKVHEDVLWSATNAGVLSFKLPANQPEIFNTEYGLPHNSVRQVFIDQEKHIWVATKGNKIFSIKDQNFIQVADVELDFSTIAVDKNGWLWAATMGIGVLVLKNDTLLQFSSDEGLLNNFCYSLEFDNDGHVWVGHRMGISRINTDNFKVRTFESEAGITGNSNYNAILNTESGDLYIGTTHGLVVYHSSKARELPAVKPNITAVYISDQLWDHNQPIKLPYGAYKLRIEFTGISFASPEKVSYQFKLDGYDLDWSPVVSENHILYPRIDDGEFKFLLIAYNADGVPTEIPLELKISVKKPFWKQYWFIALSILVGILAVILIIKIREKAHKIREQYLEEELDKRAKELKVKNVELQKKNNDITDSINYAKRIQGSILPPIHKIEMQFPGSFVFYRPRDIVSGDFYWFDKVNESKFLIVCADSTGHGVPGAFMSMIGTTLIKDICMRSNVQSPSDVLSMLDFEIASMLNVQDTPNGDNSTDGMDLTVCEIDLNTMYLRFASAMRPIMLYHKGELLYLRGSRNAIGGQLADSKEFDNQGYQLEKGDIIYMFTDGYPDQFGGPYGKKYKIVRLKNLLGDICALPVEKQELMIVNEFNNWKGEEEQVDDVLFMCIKI
jgi:ligand-binding sensor domain-containing protein/serine phosphatase RsbU (regulator of sigma subunit)